MRYLFFILCMLTVNLVQADPLTSRVLKDSGTKNNIYSPLSLNEALAMVYAGSAGDTASEIQNGTGWGNPTQTVAFYANLNATFANLDKADQFQIKVANSLWLQKSFSLEPTYLEDLRLLNAEGHSVDFVNQAESARTDINTWVDAKTSSKIKNLIAPGLLTPLTRLVLCNAVYFKADWASPFEAIGTTKQDFTSNTGTSQVDTMHKTGHFKYFEDTDTQYIELPYKGQATSMIICLPKARNGLGNWLASLSDKQLAALPGLFDSQYERVNLALPKFKIECTQSKLALQMEKIGIKKLFSPDANLDGIAKGQGLFVSSIIQKTMVAVDEKGTEAAAATAIMVAGNAMPIEKPVDFVVDHPFVFLIVTKANPTILFAGVIQDLGQ